MQSLADEGRIHVSAQALRFLWIVGNGLVLVDVHRALPA